MEVSLSSFWDSKPSKKHDEQMLNALKYSCKKAPPQVSNMSLVTTYSPQQNICVDCFCGAYNYDFFLNTFNASWVKCWDPWVILTMKEDGPKRLIILKYIYTKSIKNVTFLKKRKTLSLLLELMLLLNNVFDMFKKVEKKLESSSLKG